MFSLNTTVRFCAIGSLPRSGIGPIVVADFSAKRRELDPFIGQSPEIRRLSEAAGTFASGLLIQGSRNYLNGNSSNFNNTFGLHFWDSAGAGQACGNGFGRNQARGNLVIARTLFERMGFKPIARHRHKNVVLYRQGEINFIVNAEPDSFAQSFARVHGPSICAIAFRVKDSALAYRKCVENGAWGVEAHPGPMELNIPAIKGIGDSLIYLVDRYPGSPANAGGQVSIYDIDFVPLPGIDQHPKGAGLVSVDHLTHNVHRGRMKEWAEFYENLFNFREVRYFDIRGAKTGLTSYALRSPCGKFCIPINAADENAVTRLSDRILLGSYLDQAKPGEVLVGSGLLQAMRQVGSAIGVAVLVYVMRFGVGFGFVPGVLTAWPFAAGTSSCRLRFSLCG